MHQSCHVAESQTVAPSVPTLQEPTQPTPPAKGLRPRRGRADTVAASRDHSDSPAKRTLQTFGVALAGVALELWAFQGESLLALALLVVYGMFCMFAIVSKLGADNPLWQCVPRVNVFHLVWCVGLPAWLGVLFFVPVVNVVFGVFVFCRIAALLNKPAWVGLFSLVPILNTFLPGYLVSSDIDG